MNVYNCTYKNKNNRQSITHNLSYQNRNKKYGTLKNSLKKRFRSSAVTCI